jgi:hypothetical protein
VIFLYAGFRRTDMSYTGKFPPAMMWSFDDLGPLGGGEQRTMWRQAAAARAAPGGGRQRFPLRGAGATRRNTRETRKSKEPQ